MGIEINAEISVWLFFFQRLRGRHERRLKSRKMLRRWRNFGANVCQKFLDSLYISIFTLNRRSSGHGDIAKFFQMCIPLATEILGAVVVKYGFESSQNGTHAFLAQDRISIRKFLSTF
jgi:hypothetical protein